MKPRILLPARSPAPTSTHHVFDEMLHRDPSTLNALLTSHTRRGDPAAALHLFHRMRRGGSRLTSHTFPPVLAACSALAPQLHSLMLRLSCSSHPVPATALLNAYSKSGRPADSLSVFDDIPDRDVVVWNAVISCLSRHGHYNGAVSAFRSMVCDGVAPTGFTICSVLKACTALLAVRQGRQVHCQAVVIGDDTIVMGTALVHFYSSCGVARDAMAVYRTLGCPGDNVLCNALVSGCVRSGRYNEAFEILREMEPNAVALTTGILACLESSNLMYGKQIHCVMVRRGFDYDTISCNAALDMYAKCGELKLAQSVFDRIREKNVVSWTSIMDAYGRHGEGVKAVELFRKMERGECGSVSPNDATFLLVISACGHSGLVDEGWEIFSSMKDKHGMHPRPEHFACVIDMFGRASRIDEAWNVFLDASESAGKFETAVCMAMFNACTMCMDLVRGDNVVKHLLELEPQNPSIYVSISNFYANTRRWDKLNALRKLMKARGLRKVLGSSQIAVAPVQKLKDNCPI